MKRYSKGGRGLRRETAVLSKSESECSAGERLLVAGDVLGYECKTAPERISYYM